MVTPDAEEDCGDEAVAHSSPVRTHRGDRPVPAPVASSRSDVESARHDRLATRTDEPPAATGERGERGEAQGEGWNEGRGALERELEDVAVGRDECSSPIVEHPTDASAEAQVDGVATEVSGGSLSREIPAALSGGVATRLGHGGDRLEQIAARPERDRLLSRRSLRSERDVRSRDRRPGLVASGGEDHALRERDDREASQHGAPLEYRNGTRASVRARTPHPAAASVLPFLVVGERGLPMPHGLRQRKHRNSPVSLSSRKQAEPTIS